MVPFGSSPNTFEGSFGNAQPPLHSHGVAPVYVNYGFKSDVPSGHHPFPRGTADSNTSLGAPQQWSPYQRHDDPSHYAFTHVPQYSHQPPHNGSGNDSANITPFQNPGQTRIYYNPQDFNNQGLMSLGQHRKRFRQMRGWQAHRDFMASQGIAW